MGKRKKIERFSAQKEVRAIARERVGEPKATRVIPNKKKKNVGKRREPKVNEYLEFYNEKE